MDQCLCQFLAIRLIATVVLQHYVVAECAVSVILTFAFGIWAAIPLVQFDISLSAGHLPDLDPMLVSLIGKPLYLSVIEVFNAQNLHPAFVVLLVNHINILKNLLIVQKHLVVLLVVATVWIVLRYLDIEIAAQRLQRVFGARSVDATALLRGDKVLVHDVDEIVLDKNLVVAVIHTCLTQELVLIALAAEVEVPKPSLHELITRYLLQELQLGLRERDTLALIIVLCFAVISVSNLTAMDKRLLIRGAFTVLTTLSLLLLEVVIGRELHVRHLDLLKLDWVDLLLFLLIEIGDVLVLDLVTHWGKALVYYFQEALDVALLAAGTALVRFLILVEVSLHLLNGLFVKYMVVLDFLLCIGLCAVHNGLILLENVAGAPRETNGRFSLPCLGLTLTRSRPLDLYRLLAVSFGLFLVLVVWWTHLNELHAKIALLLGILRLRGIAQFI